MNLRPYKFVVQAIVQQVDENGNVVGESPAEPVSIFGCEALSRWADDFPFELARVEAGKDGGVISSS